MPSIKQIEAFYWSAVLGSFGAAADKLTTTQSSISKRIQELEYSLGILVFDRSKRNIRLTAKGVELLNKSIDLLRVHMDLLQIGKADLVISGPFRFGVTEAVALSWLPQFAKLIQKSFPRLVPVSIVDTSPNLNLLLLDQKIDLAVGTEKNFDPTLVFTFLTLADRVWVASPTLIPHDRMLSVSEMGELPILGHGDTILQDTLVIGYLRQHGVTPRIVTSCTNLSALAHMTMEGIGMTYIHRDVFMDKISSGRLKIVRTALEIPPLQYVAVHRDDAISPVASLIAAKALEVCNFSPPLANQ